MDAAALREAEAAARARRSEEDIAVLRSNVASAQGELSVRAIGSESLQAENVRLGVQAESLRKALEEKEERLRAKGQEVCC